MDGNRSVLFCHLPCLYTTTFILLSLFSVVETIGSKIWGRPLSWRAKCSLPDTIQGSKTLHAKVYDTKFFISLFERAFKAMKNGVYFIVIVLLVAVLFMQDFDLCKLDDL